MGLINVLVCDAFCTMNTRGRWGGGLGCKRYLCFFMESVLVKMCLNCGVYSH